MNIRRIKTVIKHSWYHLNHSMETWIDLIWFPVIQLLVFGFLTGYLAKEGGSVNILLLGFVFWIIIQVGQYSITVGALWEIWSNSFSSLFISPLTLEEFAAGHMISGMVKAVGVFALSALVSQVFFSLSILPLGWMIFVYFAEMVLFSWSAGMFILALIFRYGTDIQSLAWGLVFIVQPLAAVFYPVEALPKSLQAISYIFPVTYVFEALRRQFSTGMIDVNLLAIGTALNALFFMLSYLFMRSMLDKAKESGSFVRLEH